MTKRRHLKDILFGPLARGSAIVFSGTVLTSALGYGLQIVLGRLLGVADYGLLSSLIAFYIIVTSPLNALMLSITKEASHFLATRELGKLKGLLVFLFTKPLIYWLGFCVLLLLCAPILIDIIKGSDYANIICIVALIAAGFIVSSSNAVISAFQFFATSSALGMTVVVLKIIAVCLFVWAGLRVDGAIMGFFTSSVIVAAIGFTIISKQLRPSKAEAYNGKNLHLRRIVPIFLSYVSLTTISHYDVLLVKYLFNAQDAGQFALAAVLGKSIYFLPISVATALFPIAAQHHALNNDGRKILFTACAYVLVLSAIGSLIFWFLGGWIITLLYGADKTLTIEVLRMYGFVMIPLAITYIIEHYYIATGKVLVPLFIFASTVLQIIALTLTSVNIITLVHIEAYINYGCLLFIIAYVYKVTKGTYRFT